MMLLQKGKGLKKYSFFSIRFGYFFDILKIFNNIAIISKHQPVDLQVLAEI